MLRFFAVYGNPIAHSKSPLLHNHAFSRCAINAFYGRLLLENGKDLRESFKAHHLSGANITIPFKEEAYRQCDEVCGIAKEIGACNTWVCESGKIIGYNTDAQGFYESVKDFKMSNALILGAGGSARAVAMILKTHNIPTTIINRSQEKLEFFANKGFECFVSDEFKADRAYSIVINTTSAGLNDESLPLVKQKLQEIFTHSCYAFDLIYGKQTPFLALARESGLECKDGREMLIYQAALALALFVKECPLAPSEIAKIMSEVL